MFQLFLEHFALVVGAIAGVLAAKGRHIDLFGVIVLALVTGLGGGSLRDILLGEMPFWVKHSPPLITVFITAIVTFYAARFIRIPHVVMALADAHGLALFTILGTKKALALGAAPLPAAGMGVVTGVAGGMIRDILLSEVPMVFRRGDYLYATAAFAGAGVYLGLRTQLWMSEMMALLISVGVILVTRIVAIRWRLSLPEFE